jgi:hypothetical protein
LFDLWEQREYTIPIIRQQLALIVSAPTTVVHCKKAPFDIYIGRPGKWGNPFVIGKDGTREEVIAKYEAYLLSTPVLIAALHELKGKALGCWCAPLACHGDILAKYADEIKLAE